LIGWHPLQTEAIAYLSARTDVFLGLALAVGVWSVERRHWGVTVVAALAAFGAKESGVMVAPLLVMWAMWRGDWRCSRRALLTICALFGLMVGFLVAQYPIHPSLTPIGQVGSLIGQLVWPFGLTVDYDWSGYTSMTGLVTVAWAVALSSVCLAVRRPQWALLIVGLGVWFLPRVLVPLSEGLHAHHITGVMPWIAFCVTAPTLQRTNGSN
jgi:hypothetical protein